MTGHDTGRPAADQIGDLGFCRMHVYHVTNSPPAVPPNLSDRRTIPNQPGTGGGENVVMSEFQCIRLSTQNQVAVVQLVDDKVMDAERIAMLGEELLSLADSQQGAKVLINMDNVRFLSSSAINKLIVLERRLTGNGGDLKLSNLSPEVEEVFNITQLSSVFDICPDEQKAIESFE